MKFRARISTESGDLIEQEFEVADDHPLARAMRGDVIGFSIDGEDVEP
jgi:hypothetical protein